MNDLVDRYFDWMCNYIFHRREKALYSDLLHFLFEKDFDYLLKMDENRAVDGIDLRYRFRYENGESTPSLETLLDDKPCSILEMMVALCIRCEENIMHDPSIGDRTGFWFWNMLKSLDLYFMNNEHFDQDYVEEKINIFLNHEYEPNGKGGLFTIQHSTKDLRNTEIWYQLYCYLNDISEE